MNVSKAGICSTPAIENVMWRPVNNIFANAIIVLYRSSTMTIHYFAVRCQHAIAQTGICRDIIVHNVSKYRN